MRGLHSAIVDEADSVMIDEAVTPLIIAGDGPNPEQVEAFKQAADIAGRLVKGKHYRANERFREIEDPRIAADAARLKKVLALDPVELCKRLCRT